MLSKCILFLFLCGSLIDALKVGIITEESHVPTFWPDEFPHLELLAISTSNSTSLSDSVCEAVEQGARVVVDSTSRAGCALLKHLSATSAIPVVFTSGCTASPTTVALSASALEMQDILYEVSPMLEWGPSGVITDKLSDVSASLLRSLSSQGKLQHYWEGNNYVQGLLQLRKNSVFRILVAIPPEDVADFISTAIALNLDKRFSFLFTTPMKTVDLQRVQVIPNDQRVYPSMFAITYPETNAERFSTQESLSLDALSLINRSMEYFPSEEFMDFPIDCQQEKVWSHIEDVMKYLSHAEVKGHSGDVKIEGGERVLSSLHINSVILNEEGDVHVEDLGEWRKERGILERNKRQLRPLRVTTFLGAPYMMVEEDIPESEGNEHYKGFLKDLLDELKDKVDGFKYTIHPVKDGKYGGKNPDGTWNGMIGELVRNEADIAAASLTQTAARNDEVDFTKGFLVTGLSALYLKPGTSIAGSWVFLHPFSAGLWLCILAAWLLTSLVLYIIGRVSPYEDQDDSEELTLQTCLWYTLTSMLFRNWIPLKAPSSRFLLTLWWWFSLIMLILYASISSFLFTNAIRDPPMMDVKDLLDSGLEFGTLSSGATRNFFQVSKKDIHQKMAAKMSSPSSHTDSYQEGIDRVKEGGYAYIMETAAADYAISQDCSLTRLPTQIHSRQYGLALQRGSPYTDRLSHAILLLEEDGSIAALYDKWWSQDQECSMGVEGDSSQLGEINVFSVGGVLITFLLGLIVAVGLGFGEKFFKQYRGGNSKDEGGKKNRKNQDVSREGAAEQA